MFTEYLMANLFIVESNVKNVKMKMGCETCF